MPSSVTPRTLDRLARRLDGLADRVPSTPEAVDPVALADDISVLAHHLQRTVERAQARFTAPETVHPSERATLVQLATATAGIAHALHTLTEALAYATTGFQREGTGKPIPSHLRSDPQILRTLAAEHCVTARFRLRDTATALREASAPSRPSAPQASRPPTQPATTPQSRQPARR
ncbi:hypothetical protein [Streptomyces griseiscabiei]|uniref:Uncharacterized protein n=1 Tax=Streptomyces griseiscabiei TaxID=2993540 RepID=A0ABU4KXM5_9ACTN|nr:hypothetical protein [Streptomyces griseiscabiei]MBZ3904434.1 hypothetical protein [Streptomyces griseiscabiei]MDX2908182.1 hypothetical protein [Streptomyces griseiscabiei]